MADTNDRNRNAPMATDAGAHVLIPEGQEIMVGGVRARLVNSTVVHAQTTDANRLTGHLIGYAAEPPGN